MSNTLFDWNENSASRRKGKSNEDDLPERLNYGTHTLPKEFWVTIKRGLNCLSDPAYKERRKAKALRRIKNLEARGMNSGGKK